MTYQGSDSIFKSCNLLNLVNESFPLQKKKKKGLFCYRLLMNCLFISVLFFYLPFVVAFLFHLILFLSQLGSCSSGLLFLVYFMTSVFVSEFVHTEHNMGACDWK